MATGKCIAASNIARRRRLGSSGRSSRRCVQAATLRPFDAQGPRLLFSFGGVGERETADAERAAKEASVTARTPRR